MRLVFSTLLLLFGFCLATSARAAEMRILTPRVLPGQTVIAAFDTEPTSVTFGTEKLTAFPYRSGWRVIAPVPLGAAPGRRLLGATVDNQTVSRSISIGKRKSLVIELPVPPKLNQTPQQLVKNLTATNTDINTQVKQVTNTTFFSTPFGLPLSNNKKISSVFGEVRKTGNERITHLGADFVLPKGSVVAAINSGVVAKAYVDATYGNSVFIDHGRGIFTLYLHLDSIRVKVGDAVKKGTIVGTLGETGLASAPHLHLSLKIGGVSVDPLQFVSSFK